MAISNIPGPYPAYLDSFAKYLTVIKGHSSKTAYEYVLNTTLFMRYLKSLELPKFRGTDVSDITIQRMSDVQPEDITDYMYYEQGRGSMASTRSNKLSALYVFYEYLRREKYIKANPVQDVDHPKLQQRVPKYLTLEQANHLLDTVQSSNKANGVRDYCILTIFLNCGLRLEELRMLNVGDIQDTKNVMLIRGKGDKEREVPINDAVLGAVHDYLQVREAMKKRDGEKALFVSRQTGRRISRSTIQKMVERRLLDAGLAYDHMSTHKLRHTSATLMYGATGDIRSLQEVLGHTTIATTEQYVHVNSEQKRRLVKQNPLNLADGENEGE